MHRSLLYPVTNMNTAEHRTARRYWNALVAFLPVLIGCSGTDGVHFGRIGIAYSHMVRTQPRPLRIHVLRVDLASEALVLGIATAADPDGNGPAETTLLSPLDHFARGRFLAGVNANAWSMVPPTPDGKAPRYVAGAACNICGWVVADGVQISPPESGYWSFWLDSLGTPHIGNVAAPVPGTRLAIAGFGGLVEQGRILPGPSQVCHPRTALGLDKTARTLILTVVDGRQPYYSEGMSERELAELMLELGCWDALNLDGGGSTVMILRSEGEAPRIVNRPSDRSGPRPIPVLLGVKQSR